MENVNGSYGKVVKPIYDFVKDVIVGESEEVIMESISKEETKRPPAHARIKLK